jgi:ATP-dependent helicase/nuclease subunit A
LRLPFDEPPDVPMAPPVSSLDVRDSEGRARAVDPRFNVALEASAGTGKTRVLVDRYINLLRAGVAPANILAITFTRKAAAEMRERILATLRLAAERGELTPSQWRELRDRTGDISISTIDAFCLSLLREFPLEADLDPGFSMADDTEVPRLVDESLDRTLRICRGLARDDEQVALVFAQLGDRRLRSGLASLLNRRLVAPQVLARFLARSPRDLTVASAVRRGAEALLAVFAGMKGGVNRFVSSGPAEPAFDLCVRELKRIEGGPPEGGPHVLDPAAVQAAFAKAREHFLTHDGQPRSRPAYLKAQFRSDADYRAHRELVAAHADRIRDAHRAFRRDLNVVVARAVARIFRIAESEYRRTLAAHAVLDFSDVLLRALDLMRQMEEFAQSRFRLESRYHHVLVDEFQDTSKAQWELISLLVQAWGEGAGLAHSGPLPPSIFIVGDRKQSIYGFRDAQASILREATAHLSTLRPDGDVRRSISRSFRSVPALLSFVNDVCRDMPKAPERDDAFHYGEDDRFPVPADGPSMTAPVSMAPLGIIAGESAAACAGAVAAEIARLLAEEAPVRDRDTGVRRPVTPGDIGILFRTRDSHREVEDALARHRIPSYVYKGLGFFDADEIKDLLALLWYVADPSSNLRAAALLRSRVVRLTDEGLRQLAPDIAGTLSAPSDAPIPPALSSADAAMLQAARVVTRRWRQLADRIPPAELLDRVLNETAYAVELRGSRAQQARENVKKLRALIRRIQNRGYATLARIAAHLDRLAIGDEANAAIDARDAVNLMTVHAAKGLEFPIVFVVNLARGTGSVRSPIRVTPEATADDVPVAVGDFLSDADEDEAAREREEAKRLLYVALTRARDVLYLSTPLTDGVVAAARGSLAEIMPSSFLALFAEAGRGPAVLDWHASSGAVHRLLVGARFTGPDEGGPPKGGPYARPDDVKGGPSEGGSDVLTDSSVERLSVAEAASEAAAGTIGNEGSESTRLLGTLVHRVIERLTVDGLQDREAVRRQVHRLLREHERVAVGNLDAVDKNTFVENVVQTCALFGDREDLREVYASGTPLHEVPFTLRDDSRYIRGTIDCLVRGVNGQLTVVEFKTGRQRAEHQEQAEVYTRAVRAAFPGSVVEARIFYADRNHLHPGMV